MIKTDLHNIATGFRIGALCVSVLLTACGGSGSSGSGTGPDGAALPPVAIAAATEINAVITEVTIAGPPVVEFLLTNAAGNPLSGLPASSISFVVARLVPGTDGNTRFWQSYINQIEAPGVGPGTLPKLQADTENGSAGELVETAPGSYRYTFALDITAVTEPEPVAYLRDLTHRVSFEIRGFAPVRNPVFDFRPGDNAVTDLLMREIASTTSCNACHGNLALHGGARFEMQNCVTCHNPGSTDANSGNSVDMAAMTHKIHMGQMLPSVIAGADYCIYGRNNSLNCYGDVIYTDDIKNCSGCHDSGDPVTPQASRWYEWPTAETCGACHDDVDFITGENHGSAGPADNSQCISCHANNSASPLEVRNAHRPVLLEQAANYRFDILAVDFQGPGAQPQVTFAVVNPQNNAMPYDLANDPDLTRSRLRLGVAWDTVDYSNTGTTAGNSQAQLTNIYDNGVLLAQDNGDYTYSLVLSPVAAGARGSGVITFEGSVESAAGRLPVTSAYQYFSITDDPLSPTPRRTVADIERCNDCHRPMSFHGSSRNDSIEACQICHLADAARTSNLGPMDMKYFVHRLHAVDDIRYPQGVGNCLACHTTEGFYPVAADSGVLATSISRGADQTDPTDNNRISPNTAACSVCHASESATDHMTTLSGSFDACQETDGSLRERVDFCGPGGDKNGALIVETCADCHGAGKFSDVALVHELL
jgi:OmcA/MtrC family decaheme c-type cytochrome